MSNPNELGSTKKPAPIPLFFRKLYRDPYGTLDNLDLKFLGFQFNIMKDDQKLLKAMEGPFVIAPALAWVFTSIVMLLTTPYNGFDAELNQLSYPLTALLMGQGWETAIFHFFNEYGKGCHWSAVLIYFGFYYYLSKHFRKIGLTNSINISFTTCFTALTIAIFEYFWTSSYYFLQGQHWIIGFVAPQTMITIQNLVLFMLGALRIANINWKVLKPNFNTLTCLFLDLTLVSMVIWWVYGLMLPVQVIQVMTDAGPWRSSPLFPQTVYTIALNPESSIHVNSIAIWVHNDLLHLLNLLVKVFLTLACLNIFLLEERKNVKE